MQSTATSTSRHEIVSDSVTLSDSQTPDTVNDHPKLPADGSETGRDITATSEKSTRDPQPKLSDKMQWKRFLAGMLITATGLLLMFIVTAGMVVDVNDERLSLPVVALSMILGLMMLGGGFGLMATASPNFDDGEFDRLMAESRPESRK